jgi:hypothetical protein
MTPFNNLLSPEFKSLFNQAIDTILDPSSGLVNPCVLKYAYPPTQLTLCNNCIYDTISMISSNIYNGTGPQPFPEGGICPVCVGTGSQSSQDNNQSQETVNIAVITDGKYFVNVSSALNIPPNAIQTICNIELLPKINNAIELVVNNSSYQKAGAPQFCGLATHSYIIMLWSSA